MTGLVRGDSVAAPARLSTAATPEARGVGGGYTVSDGNGGGNYSVPTNSAAGSITPATLTLSPTTDSRVYNGTSASAATPTVTGLFAGDTLRRSGPGVRHP